MLLSLDPYYRSLEPRSEVQNFEDRGLSARADFLVARADLGAELETVQISLLIYLKFVLLIPIQIVTLEAQI